MPVTTRSQGKASTQQDLEPDTSPKPLSKTITKAPCTTDEGRDIPNSITPTTLHGARATLLSTRNPRKRSPTHKALDQKKRSRPATDLSSLENSDFVLTHFSCQSCSCLQGAFYFPVDNCIRCGHTMDDHEDINHRWNSECDFVCQRSDLVNSILQLVRCTRVVVIRATPQVGKTTLLRLLGHHILYNEKDLEPILIEWKPGYKRHQLPYQQYLEQEKSKWQEDNKNYRPQNPKATPIYLIDEAQDSYEEEQFWTQTLKNPNTRQQPMFVLVCLYGAIGLSRMREPNIQSQALLMDRLQRVELRPSVPGRPYMLFKPQETADTVQKWAMANDIQLKPGVSEYLHAATDGHPGMVGLILLHFRNLSRQIINKIDIVQSSELRRPIREWSPERCHENLVEHKALLEWFTIWGRGLWTPEAEKYVKECLRHPVYSYISFSEVAKALREVATEPNGMTRVQREFDAFAFCYKMGFLHAEQRRPGSEESTVAYRRLCPGPEPTPDLQKTSLQQICLNAIARLSPSVFQYHTFQGVPEATFHDEMYCCLSYELQSLPILSEYSHTKDGRIDFYVFDKKWGIEILRSRSKADITEHIRRFQTGGKYHGWNIFDDSIVLNFCSKATLQKIEIEDVSIQPRFLQIAIDLEECTAEVYTNEKQLRATLDLGEGRQRAYADDLDTEDNLNAFEALQARLAQVEREQETIEREKETIERRLAEMQSPART